MTTTLPLNPYVQRHPTADCSRDQEVAGKRIVLASDSPQRRKTLRTFVCVLFVSTRSESEATLNSALAGPYLRLLQLLLGS